MQSATVDLIRPRHRHLTNWTKHTQSVMVFIKFGEQIDRGPEKSLLIFWTPGLVLAHPLFAGNCMWCGGAVRSIDGGIYASSS